MPLFQAVGQLLLTLACAGLSSTPSLDICAAHHSFGEAYHSSAPTYRARRPPCTSSIRRVFLGICYERLGKRAPIRAHPDPSLNPNPLRAHPDPRGPPSERRGWQRVQLEAAGYSTLGQDDGGDGRARSDGQWTGRTDLSQCV